LKEWPAIADNKIGGTMMSFNSYIVGFDYDDKIEANIDTAQERQNFLDANVNQNVAFQQKLMEWIIQQGLEEEVAGYGEPLCFPILSIRCTEKVAQAIKELPAVNFVTKDGL